MIWFIISAIIIIVLTVKAFREDGFGESVAVFFITFFVSLLASLLLNLIIGGIMSTFVDLKEVTYNSSNLIALQDNSSTSGSFFLGCGSVDEENYYYYLVQEQKGMKEEKVETDDAYIQYTNDTPHIDTVQTFFSNDFYYWFGIPTFDNYYIIYVPEGSVTNQFNIDLKN